MCIKKIKNYLTNNPITRNEILNHLTTPVAIILGATLIAIAIYAKSC